MALGALKSMTTVLLVGALGQARYVTHIARAHIIPPWLALVHPKTKTPIYATLLVTISSACIAFFSSLDILATLLSVSTLFIFMMMAVALLVRRYYAKGVTPRPNLVKLVGLLSIIIASSIGISACWGLKSGWVGKKRCGGSSMAFRNTWDFTVVATTSNLKSVGSALSSVAPTLSITTNLLLMGSLGYMAFIRFVLFGLNATYDMAHQETEFKLDGIEEDNDGKTFP